MREASRSRRTGDPGEQLAFRFAAALVKLRRGPAVKAVGGGGGEIPRGHKPRRAAAFGRSFTRFPEVSDSHREKGLEGALRFRASARSWGKRREGNRARKGPKAL